MKRWILGGAVVLVLALGIFFAYSVLGTEKGQGCLSKHSDNLIGCVLAGPVALTVQVVGDIDQVLIYRADDETNPMATISTSGKAVTQTVQLPTHYQYYMVMKKGTETYRSKTVGFDSNQSTATLTIRGIGQWEGW